MRWASSLKFEQQVMRQIYDPISGANVTSTVQAILAAQRSLVTAHTYRWQFMNFVNYNPY